MINIKGIKLHFKQQNETLVFVYMYISYIFLLRLNGFVIFAQSEHEVLMMRFCDCVMSIVHRACVRACVRPSVNKVSSDTIGINLMKLAC